jgi:transcriptional regulator with XRE-family HTH domain
MRAAISSKTLEKDLDLLQAAIRATGSQARLGRLCGVDRTGPRIWRKRILGGRPLSPSRRSLLERIVAEESKPLARRRVTAWTAAERRAFGTRFSQFREARGLRTDTLAHVLGITEELLWAYERGELEPPVSVVGRLVQRFPSCLEPLLGLPLQPSSPDNGSQPPVSELAEGRLPFQRRATPRAALSPERVIARCEIAADRPTIGRSDVEDRFKTPNGRWKFPPPWIESPTVAPVNEEGRTSRVDEGLSAE